MKDREIFYLVAKSDLPDGTHAVFSPLQPRKILFVYPQESAPMVHLLEDEVEREGHRHISTGNLGVTQCDLSYELVANIATTQPSRRPVDLMVVDHANYDSLNLQRLQTEEGIPVMLLPLKYRRGRNSQEVLDESGADFTVVDSTMTKEGSFRSVIRSIFGGTKKMAGDYLFNQNLYERRDYLVVPKN